MGPEKFSAAEIFRLQQFRCSCLQNPSSAAKNSLLPYAGNFDRNRLILRCFPMRLKAKFPANCKNTLQIPAYQGIWMLIQVRS